MFIYAGSEQCDLGPIYTIRTFRTSKTLPGEWLGLELTDTLNLGAQFQFFSIGR